MSKLLRKSPTSLSSTAAKNLSIDDIHLRVHIQGRGTPNNGCPARTVDGLCTAIAAPANNRDPAQPDGDLGRGCVGEWIGSNFSKSSGGAVAGRLVFGGWRRTGF